jgi:RHS repeat-associated protein
VVVVALDGLRMPGGEPAVEQRTVRYGYDGLARLTAATETPGRRYRYAYDGVGNRSGVWVNDVPTATMQYDAANQVLRWSYDAAGNLLSDGTRTLRYDALGRLSSAAAAGTTTRYGYNGDGVLVTQTTTGTTTSYTQDLQAPLSQVLEQTTSGTTTRYWYELERLAAVADSTRTWYGTDALGSVRQTLTDTGTASAAIHYDPWGTPTEGTLPNFGFTGELQDATSGLVHLRPRWYLPAQGAFASRDPFQGFEQYPQSLQPYLYVGNNPVNLRDPSGLCYPPFTTLRSIEPMNCQNLDQAIYIASHPNANWKQRAVANTYIVTFWGSHAALVVGLVGLGYAGPTGLYAWGQAYLTTHGTTAVVAGGAALLANGADEAILLYRSTSGDTAAAGEYMTLQQLGAADGVMPFGDILTAGKMINGSRDSWANLCTGARYGHPMDDYTRWEVYAPQMYEDIRNSDDVAVIAAHTGIPAFQVARIKDHLFFKTHQLDYGRGIRRFDPDPDIADAWERLRRNQYLPEDLQLLKHEYFESRYESLYKTDYRTADNAAKSRYPWSPPQ